MLMKLLCCIYAICVSLKARTSILMVGLHIVMSSLNSIDTVDFNQKYMVAMCILCFAWEFIHMVKAYSNPYYEINEQLGNGIFYSLSAAARCTNFAVISFIFIPCEIQVKLITIFAIVIFNTLTDFIEYFIYKRYIESIETDIEICPEELYPFSCTFEMI
jgi:hypothetical protein